MTKVCTVCKKVKPLTEFRILPKTGKYLARCNACKLIYEAAYRKRVAADENLKLRDRESKRRWWLEQRADPVRWAALMKEQREKRKAKWRDDPHYRAVTTAKNTRARLRRKEDPVIHARYLEGQRARTAQIKDIVFDFYGNQCECCGEREQAFLVIDHVNGNGAKHRKNVGTGVGFYWTVIKEDFPSDYRILCCNCNWGRWVNSGICPHQSLKPSETISEESTPQRVEAPSLTVSSLQ